MKSPHPRTWTQAEIAQQAFEMLAIGNVATRRAQAQNRAKGIPNYYSIAGRIVSDADKVEALFAQPPVEQISPCSIQGGSL